MSFKEENRKQKKIKLIRKIPMFILYLVLVLSIYSRFN